VYVEKGDLVQPSCVKKMQGTGKRSKGGNRGNVTDYYERPAGERKKGTYGSWRIFGPFVWAALPLAPGDIENRHGE
jgi:hypothetical protein